MTKEHIETTKIAIFKGKKVRKIIYQNENNQNVSKIAFETMDELNTLYQKLSREIINIKDTNSNAWDVIT